MKKFKTISRGTIPRSIVNHQNRWNFIRKRGNYAQPNTRWITYPNSKRPGLIVLHSRNAYQLIKTFHNKNDHPQRTKLEDMKIFFWQNLRQYVN